MQRASILTPTFKAIASYETHDSRTISDHGSEPPSSPPAYMAQIPTTGSNPYIPQQLTPGQASQPFQQVPPMHHGSPIPPGHQFPSQLRAGSYQQFPPAMAPGQGLPYPVSEKPPHQSSSPPQIAELASTPVVTGMPKKEMVYELASPQPSPAISQGSFSDQKAAQGVQGQAKFSSYSPNGWEQNAPPSQDAYQE